jgi:hypothetical protein
MSDPPALSGIAILADALPFRSASIIHTSAFACPRPEPASRSALARRVSSSDRPLRRRPQGFQSSSGPFGNRRQASNLSTLPGSTDTAFAVKTERLPPYGLPPHYDKALKRF